MEYLWELLQSSILHRQANLAGSPTVLKSGMFDRNEDEDCLANFTVVWSDMFSGSLSFPPAWEFYIERRNETKQLDFLLFHSPLELREI